MLNHILTSCPKALAEGRYSWRHDTVLAEISNWVEQQRIKANKKQAGPPEAKNFIREGDKAPRSRTTPKNPPSILHRASDWELSVDLKRKLVFPQDVAVTSLQPDMEHENHHSRQTHCALGGKASHISPTEKSQVPGLD